MTALATFHRFEASLAPQMGTWQFPVTRDSLKWLHEPSTIESGNISDGTPVRVVIERDSEGYYVASVPQLPACHAQAQSLDEIMLRVSEAIELCLEVEGVPGQDLEFVGIQRVTIAA